MKQYVICLFILLFVAGSGVASTPLEQLPPENPASPVQSNNELDEFLGYNIYISTDGVHFILANDTLITDREYHTFYGSEWEDQEVYLYATAMVDIQGEITESQPSEVDTVLFNCAPCRPQNLDGTSDNENLVVTLTWDIPTLNEDGSELIDLAGFNIYRGDEVIGTVGAEMNTYTDTCEYACYYWYRVTAFDEVPNESPRSFPAVLLVGEPDYQSGFDPGDYLFFLSDEVAWEHGEAISHPDSAWSPPNVWATCLNSAYNQNENSFLTCTETFYITETYSQLTYMHWFDYDTNWDGYNLQVSTDNGDTWEVLEPRGGYPHDTVIALDDQPGFTGVTNCWQRVFFDLGNYQHEMIQLRFRHGADAGLIVHYGVSLDDFQFFGAINTQFFGSLEGTVIDCDEVPVEDAQVHVLGTNYSGRTDENGYYLIEEVLAGTWDVEVTHDYYWPTVVESVQIGYLDTTILDFEDLEYPDGETSEQFLYMTVRLGNDQDSMTIVDFDLSSVGCGPLEWTGEIDVFSVPWREPDRTLIAGDNPSCDSANVIPNQAQNESRKPANPENKTDELDELWEPLFYLWELENEIGTSNIYGVIVQSSQIYISAFESDYFYICTRDGELRQSVPLPASIDGLYDLSYDGYYFYAIAYNESYSVIRWHYNELNNYEVLFDVPTDTATGLAWNDEMQACYVSDGESVYCWIAESGDFVDIPVPDAASELSGLSCFSEDPDGFTLWLFSQRGDDAVMLRINPETGECDEGTLVANNLMSGGCHVGLIHGFDTWTVQCVLQGEQDYLAVYEGYPFNPGPQPQSWLTMSQTEGTIESGEQINIQVTVDVRGNLFPAEEPGGIENEMCALATIYFNGPHWSGISLPAAIIFLDTGVEESIELPSQYALHQNTPNPFNPTTRILFDLVETQQVRLTVYNTLGQEVARLVEEPMEAGYHEVVWDASAVASGVYFYRIETQAFTSMKKMVLVK